MRRLKRDLESGESRALAETGTPETGSDTAIAAGLAKRHKTGLIATASILMFLGAGVVGWRWANVSGSPDSIDSVAVLPFVNATGTSDAEYLSDGLADTITNSLSRLRSLRVIPRTLVARYQNQGVDPSQAGRELNVRAVVTGRVVQRNDRLYVQVELIDVASVAQLWGEQFDRPLADVLIVHGEIAKAIADRLRPQLTSDDAIGLAAGSTQNADAFQLYLKGRYELNKRSRDGLNAGAQSFERAIQADPTYSLAHAGLANAYNMQAFYGALPSNEAFPKAIDAATKAVELDERSADAHAALGWTRLRRDWNWTLSEREFRRALAIDPSHATAHQWLGAQVLLTQGRFDEAIAECKSGEALDPLSPGIALGSGFTLLFASRYDEAIETLGRALALEPNFATAHRFLAIAYRLKGMTDLAIAESQRAHDLGDPLGRVDLAVSYAASGNKREAVALVEKWIAESRQIHGGAFDIHSSWRTARQSCERLLG